MKKAIQKVVAVIIGLVMFLSSVPVMTQAAATYDEGTNYYGTPSSETVPLGETFTVKVQNKAMSLSSFCWRP